MSKDLEPPVLDSQRGAFEVEKALVQAEQTIPVRRPTLKHPFSRHAHGYFVRESSLFDILNTAFASGPGRELRLRAKKAINAYP